eukprot:8749569-Pyramimonas_sp.AAC.1
MNPCPWKAFWGHDFLGCVGGLFGRSLGAPWGSLGASWGPLERLTGLRGSLLVASGGLLAASRARDLEILVGGPPLGPLLGSSWGTL